MFEIELSTVDNTNAEPLTSVFMTKEEAQAEVEHLRTVFSERFYEVCLDRDPTDDPRYSWYVAINRR